MNLSSLIDNNKFRSRPSDKKVIEFRQKPESIVYLVSCWLAVSAIENWLSRKEEPCSPLLAQNLLEFWLDERESPKGSLLKGGVNDEVRFKLLSFLQKSESGGSLFDKLEIIFDNLCQEYHYLIAQEGGNKFLSRIKEEVDSLEKTCCSVTLRNNGEVWRIKLLDKFKELVSLKNQSSVGGQIAFLNETSSFFAQLEGEYEQQRAMYREQGDDYRQKYQRAFQSISTTDKEVIRNFEIAKEAILNSAKFKIAASSCSIAASIFKGLKLESQKYLDYYRSSHLFLSEIQADFLTQIVGKEHCVLIESWGSYKEADLWRERVEKRLGRSLTSWGTSKHEGIKEISASQVKDALREELMPIAKKICLNTYERLKKEFV